MITTEALRRELRINRGIDDAMNELLTTMKEFVDSTRIWESRMEVHQMHNLVSVTGETGSVELVKNFIRYQIGRDDRSDNWRWRVGGVKSFGERLVDKLDELREMAQGIVSEAGVSEASEREVDRAWMTLTRHYLGHLNRYFYYMKRTKGGERP